jgi:hypothetical protein
MAGSHALDMDVPLPNEVVGSKRLETVSRMERLIELDTRTDSAERRQT